MTEEELKSVRVNLNDSCVVRLRKSGADRLNQESLEFKRRFPDVRVFQDPKMYSAGDEYKCQLWGLMHTFGDMISLGGVPPFETEIEVHRG